MAMTTSKTKIVLSIPNNVKFLFVAAFLGLAACQATTFQRDWNKVGTFVASVDAGCAVALPLALQMRGDATFGPYVAAGVIAGCSTAAGVAKLMADPNTPVWLGQQVQILKDALSQLKLKKLHQAQRAAWLARVESKSI